MELTVRIASRELSQKHKFIGYAPTEFETRAANGRTDEQQSLWMALNQVALKVLWFSNQNSGFDQLSLRYNGASPLDICKDLKDMVRKGIHIV